MPDALLVRYLVLWHGCGEWTVPIRSKSMPSNDRFDDARYAEKLMCRKCGLVLDQK
ncbi:hypothetical protein KO516_06345 [Citreicella sp. C3M06]|uniref:hypothetical protein n=1 Tax=Citreicella sp. C3M06 TaxID=2841564 RepID=UPI001C095F3F|nr:hypothetical protein [Citreicella sp. C3M06]MBU2960441.1 hypothetical protein [Citreicella sp. C3M06]